jgi:hypothetical protein
MKTPFMVLLILGSLFVDFIVLLISARTGLYLGYFLVLGLSFWLASDSAKMQLKYYKSDFAHGPVLMFIACAVLWIAVVPWYLWMRYRIENGSAELKDEAVEAAV